MYFKPVLTIPFGKYDNGYTLYKIIFESNSDSFLTLEGFIVYSVDKQYIVIGRELNNISDYKIIDTDNKYKTLITEEFDKDIPIQIVNNNVDGYPKIIEATIKVPSSIETKTDDTYGEYITKIQKENLQLYLHIVINLKTNVNIMKSATNYPEEVLVSNYLYEAITYDIDLLKYIAMDNEYYMKMFKDIVLLRPKIKLSIENIYKYTHIVKLLLNNNIEEIKTEDMLYLIRIVDLPNSMIMSIYNRMQEDDESELILTKDDTYPIDKVFNALLSLTKITHIVVIAHGINTTFPISPKYQRDFIDEKNIQGHKKISLQGLDSDKKIDPSKYLTFFFNVNNNTFKLNYSDDTGHYGTITKMNDNFELVDSNEHLFVDGELKFIFVNRREYEWSY